MVAVGVVVETGGGDGISAHMATPQGDRLYPPMRQLVGMGLQGLGVNPGLANPKRPRPAVGDQVQGADGMPRLTLLAQAFADPFQGISVLHTV